MLEEKDEFMLAEDFMLEPYSDDEKLEKDLSKLDSKHKYFVEDFIFIQKELEKALNSNIIQNILSISALDLIDNSCFEKNKDEIEFLKKLNDKLYWINNRFDLLIPKKDSCDTDEYLKLEKEYDVARSKCWDFDREYNNKLEDLHNIRLGNDRLNASKMIKLSENYTKIINDILEEFKSEITIKRKTYELLDVDLKSRLLELIRDLKGLKFSFVKKDSNIEKEIDNLITKYNNHISELDDENKDLIEANKKINDILK